MKYLLDTNVIIDFLRGNQNVVDGIRRETLEECCISDITVFELYYGAYRSSDAKSSAAKIDKLLGSITVLSTAGCMKEAARQKAMLASDGNLIEDFDIIIGAAAIVSSLILVTGNARHLERLSGLSIENWKNLH